MSNISVWNVLKREYGQFECLECSEKRIQCSDCSEKEIQCSECPEKGIRVI